MSIDPKIHAELVSQFQADLPRLSEREMVRKHILSGTPVVMHDAGYFDLRRRTAARFGISNCEVVVVGSCKTGFSITDDYPYAVVRTDSDVDLAIVSQVMFDEYWEAVFRFAHDSTEFRNSAQYAFFADDIHRGWLMPRGFPPIRTFPKAREWTQFFDLLTAERPFGPRRINAKLYRSWSRLETYQEIMVRRRRNELNRSGRR